MNPTCYGHLSFIIVCFISKISAKLLRKILQFLILYKWTEFLCQNFIKSLWCTGYILQLSRKVQWLQKISFSYFAINRNYWQNKYLLQETDRQLTKDIRMSVIIIRYLVHRRMLKVQIRNLRITDLRV